MNKFTLMLAALALFSLNAKEWKDIPYYEKDAPVQGDLAYRTERCKLDLRVPDRRTKFPTLVWLHGGGMKKGSKKTLPIINTQAVAVATVNYRLSPKAQCPDYIYDAAAAVTPSRSTLPDSQPAAILLRWSHWTSAILKLSEFPTCRSPEPSRSAVR